MRVDAHATLAAAPDTARASLSHILGILFPYAIDNPPPEWSGLLKSPRDPRNPVPVPSKLRSWPLLGAVQIIERACARIGLVLTVVMGAGGHMLTSAETF